MKSKLFLIGLVMVLAVLIAAPVAADGTSGTTIATGQVVPATISITAPSAVNLGKLKIGDNTGSSATPGMVIVTKGTLANADYPIAYSVSAKDSNTGAGAGFMMNGTTPLSTTNKFMISSNGTTYVAADGGINYTGSAANANPINLPYYVKQVIDGTEALGTYNITITFTASLP